MSTVIHPSENEGRDGGLPDATCSSSVEDAVVAMIRSRGKVGRRKYRTTMDRRDLHPDEWVQHHQEELADALQYAERLKGMAELLHTARDIMLTLLHERDWECASQWVDRYHAQFFLPTNVDVEAPPPLESDCAETEKLMGGCSLTPCSFSSSS